MELVDVTMTFHTDDHVAAVGGSFLALTGGTMSGSINMGGNDITNVNTVDGVDVSAHAARHHSGGADAMDHGSIAGLADDDHTQYLLADGTRAMSGNLDMGTNAITNVGNVDGVDVSAHAARHHSGGADAMDHGSIAGLTDDDHTQYLLVDGTRAMTGGLNMGTGAITNVGNVDGVDVSAHASRHEDGGSDEMDLIGLDGQNVSWDVWNIVTTSTSSMNLKVEARSVNPSGGNALTVREKVTLKGLTVNAQHSDVGTPPSTWTFKLIKNSTSTASPDATFTFNWNATSGVEEITEGTLSSDIDISPGDYFWFFADGSAITGPQVRIRLDGVTAT